MIENAALVVFIISWIWLSANVGNIAATGDGILESRRKRRDEMLWNIYHREHRAHMCTTSDCDHTNLAPFVSFETWKKMRSVEK